ncbi:MAG: hypothetical protein INH41_13940 [Myxococcaceae bacterium]|jgi:hypothetical protein|nr:hypothetical protein [Myxococcaceae bacterium]MCA3013480.1 hypothetical protein [Myxococcaceae bacterium]
MRCLRLWVVVGLMPGCLSIPTSADAEVSYAAVESPWPASPVCLNQPGVAVAKEVLFGRTRTVVIAGGSNPIPDERWPSYTPSLGNQKNSDRFLLFTRSCFSRSPGKSASCEGEACRDVIELDGYTWVGLSKVEAADCVGVGGCTNMGANPGALFVVVTRKCHELVFENEGWFLDGPNGERAIMHATATGTVNENVTLPAGWTLKKEALATPLVLRPFGGGDACFYNIIRDHTLQAYHQFKYATPRYP